MTQNQAKNNKISGHLPSGWRFLAPRAKALGFAAVGIAPAGQVPLVARAQYEKWLSMQFQKDLTYLTHHRNQRFDTTHPEILAAATSVIVAAVAYGDGATVDGFWPHVAFHARSRDYHKTLKGRLKRLAQAITERYPEARYRIFVDTAPIMERTWALLAGIGSLLKNGAIHVDDIGPRVLLGEIVTSGAPTPTPAAIKAPFSLCRECTRCIDACPTGALEAPAVVNCHRCLSYWTIERAGKRFPKALARRTTRIFGCDICTSVCILDKTGIESALEPPLATGTLAPPLDAIPDMTDQALREILSGTALLRAGVKNIQENIKWVLKGKCDAGD